MDTIPFNSIEPLLSSPLTEVEAAFGKVKSSFDELIGCAQELASAEHAVQSAIYAAPDDDEDESQPVNDALSLREDRKFDMGLALDRALNELAGQARTLNDTRTALEQIKESLQLGDSELSMTMQIGPKTGCVCSDSQRADKT